MYQPSKVIAPSLLCYKIPYIHRREALVILTHEIVLQKISDVILKVMQF